MAKLDEKLRERTARRRLAGASSVSFAGENQEVWHFQVTDASGKVFLDMDITATWRIDN